MTALVVRGGVAVGGTATVPGDKSISHRALMVASIARGRCAIDGLGPGEDVASTARCLRSYGVRIDGGSDGVEVEAGGMGAWSAPGTTLDCGNSGTTMRLVAGLAAHHDFVSRLDGDASLRRRPMDRVVAPLRALGAEVEAADGRFPPITVRGGSLRGTTIATGVPSAQVKSCALFAALRAQGTTVVREPARTRDHTERMLASLGAPVSSRSLPDGGTETTIEAFEPPSFTLTVPGDVSSAAFLVAAALLAGGRVRIEGVGLNPTRTGFLEVCARMGGDVRWETTEERRGEPVGWIEASRSEIGSVGIEGPQTVALIDELPLVAVLATQADGETVVGGAGELRVKESDRIEAIADVLGRMGAKVRTFPDGFAVAGPTPLDGATVDARGDHRIAMAATVAGLIANGETRVVGAESAAVSWPGFDRALGGLGAEVEAS